MDDPATYVIRAYITATGVVERSDVVGAVFGQTEGLLGESMDLRSLQESDRVGRVEVDIESVGGTSAGELAIATDLGRVETAVIAAALETIDRIGPCRATIEVDRIEDVRAARRREIVERAQELLARGFEDVGIVGEDLVGAVRDATRPVEIHDFAGYPAGPDVEHADEIIVVEGRADVKRLLQFGVANVVGVEGTDVPEEIATLTEERTTTAFFDGDRGGNLLLLELAQKGDIDYVTFAPPGRAVEDLGPAAIRDALEEKVPYEDAEAGQTDGETDPTEDSPVVEHVRAVIGEHSGRVRLLDEAGAVIADGAAPEVESLIHDVAEDAAVVAVVLDGTVDQRLVDIASGADVEILIGRDRGEFTKRPVDVRVLMGDALLDRAERPA